LNAVPVWPPGYSFFPHNDESPFHKHGSSVPRWFLASARVWKSVYTVDTAPFSFAPNDLRSPASWEHFFYPGVRFQLSLVWEGHPPTCQQLPPLCILTFVSEDSSTLPPSPTTLSLCHCFQRAATSPLESDSRILRFAFRALSVLADRLCFQMLAGCDCHGIFLPKIYPCSAKKAFSPRSLWRYFAWVQFLGSRPRNQTCPQQLTQSLATFVSMCPLCASFLNPPCKPGISFPLENLVSGGGYTLQHLSPKTSSVLFPRRE